MARDIKVPVDLNDDIALRGYLQNLSVSVSSAPTYYSASEADQTSLNPNSLLSAAQLQEIVETRVKEFETEFNAVVNKVKFDLSQLVPDYTTIVKSVENSISVGDGTLLSSITSATTAAIDAGGNYALASEVLTLSTNLADNYSTTSVINSTYATQNAVGAIYEVAVEANGRVSGYRAVSDGISSVFEIYAEKFAISSSATQEGYQPFQVDTVNHKINMTSDVAIDGNLLVSKSVTADQIAANTITTAELGVIGNAYFTNDAGYTDDSAALTAQAAAESAAYAAAQAQFDANTANAAIDDIADDDILSPNEKPAIIKEYDTILDEQTGIESTATSYNITTEKTAYTNSITVLTNYLAGLTLPVLWNDVSGNTDINSALFSQAFRNVYSAKQSLLNKISMIAKSLADDAFTEASLKTTLTEVQSQGYVVPAEVANAINSNTTTISGAKISTGSITALQIAANTITADKINTSSIQSAVVTATYINALDITAGSVDATDITGTTISGKVINAGTLTASKQAIDGLRVYNSSYPNNTAPQTIAKGNSYTFPDNYSSSKNIDVVFYGASYSSGYRADRFVASPTPFVITVACSVNQALWADSFDYYTVTLSGPGITTQSAIIGSSNRTVSMTVVASVSQASSATFRLAVSTTGNSCEPMTASISAIGFNS